MNKNIDPVTPSSNSEKEREREREREKKDSLLSVPETTNQGEPYGKL